MYMTHSELLVTLNFTEPNPAYTPQQFAYWMTDLLTIGEKITYKNDRCLIETSRTDSRLSVVIVDEKRLCLDFRISDTQVLIEYVEEATMLSHADIILICTELDILMHCTYENWDTLKKEAS